MSGESQYLTSGRKPSAIVDAILLSDVIPGAAGLYSLGSATYEYLNAYLYDDGALFLGADQDLIVRHKAGTLNANTALTGVLLGTPVAQALAANSLIISNITANGDIALYGNLGGNSIQWMFYDTSAGILYLTPSTNIGILDDIPLKLGTGGTASLLYETADANANCLILALPDGGATDVPIFVIGDQSLINADLGWFNGITQPYIVMVDDDKDNFVAIGHISDDNAALISLLGFSIMPRFQSTYYFKFDTLSNVPTIFGTGAYLRIGDAAATSHSLASEDDAMFSGKTEHDGVAYFDNIANFDGAQTNFGTSCNIKRFYAEVTLATDGATTAVGLTPGAVILSAAIRVSVEVAGLDEADHHIQLGVAGTVDKYIDVAQGAAATTISVNKKGHYTFDPTTDTEAAALILTITGGSDQTPTGGKVYVEVIYLAATDLADV